MIKTFYTRIQNEQDLQSLIKASKGTFYLSKLKSKLSLLIYPTILRLKKGHYSGFGKGFPPTRFIKLSTILRNLEKR